MRRDPRRPLRVRGKEAHPLRVVVALAVGVIITSSVLEVPGVGRTRHEDLDPPDRRRVEEHGIEEMNDTVLRVHIRLRDGTLAVDRHAFGADRDRDRADLELLQIDE